MRSDRIQAQLVAGLGIVALFGFLMAVEAAQTVPAGSIAAHWPLDSITTTTADVSGNSNTATLVSTPTSTAALFGNGLTFASAKYLTVPSSASLDVAAGSFTVAAWIKPSATAVQRIINKWNGTTGFLLDINAAAGGGNTAGHLRFYLKSNATHDLAAAGSLGTGAWKHIAATLDTASTPKMARIYVNGNQVGSKDVSTLTGPLTNTAALLIGSYASANYYTGVMDEPIVYKRALTATEIKILSGIPQGPTATTTLVGKVTLSWTAVAGAASYRISRSPTSGGPYTLAGTVTAPTVTFTDNAGAGTYYYVVQAVFSGGGGYTSANSAQVTGIALPPEVTALPNLGLQTSENLATTSFTIQFNKVAPAGGSLVVVSSSDVTEGVVSTTYTGVAGSFSTTATGFQVTVPAGTIPTFTVTVTGVDDVNVDGAVGYTISVSASGFAGLVIPAVQVTNNDNDSPGITISRTSGLTTSEIGGNDTFTVSLNTQPYGPITMALTSSATTEGTVSPGTITFTPANWNTAQQVTVTGVDDVALDFTQAYFVLTGPLATTNVNDTAAYNGLQPPDVQVSNLDDETIPPLDPVWGDGGSGGSGCGLTGFEAGLALVLAAFLRCRRA